MISINSAGYKESAQNVNKKIPGGGINDIIFNTWQTRNFSYQNYFKEFLHLVTIEEIQGNLLKYTDQISFTAIEGCFVEKLWKSYL